MRALAIVLALAGCQPGPLDPTPSIAAEIVDAPGATGESFGDPTRATNGVRGGGPTQGSLDVYSLDYGDRPYLVLGFGGRWVRNGAGTDLVVFENAFRSATGASFMDPIVVAVSRDGSTFVDLPHAYRAPDPRVYSSDPDHWEGFAGVSPVLLHEEESPGDPFDPIAAGGDAFDLDALAEDGEAGAIRSEGFRFVRLTSAALEIDPATGERHPRDPASNGADVDGVYGRWLD